MIEGLGLDLIIFDCDGVLVDSEPASNRVFVEELRRLGLDFDSDEVSRRFTGLSMARCMEIVSEQLGRAVPAGFVEQLHARTFEAFRDDGLQPVEGVPEMLHRIETRFCVASSGEHEKMRLTLGLTGLLEHFEGRMFSATEVQRGKPHPDLFLLAARRMNAHPAACVVVEDSVPGVRGARAAGMAVLGYTGHSDGGELSSAGARVFRTMAELPDLLGRLRENS
jgi:HAD superfamily hydrolase (TIGR01509 family)